VRSYSFGYTASATTTQALLTGVTECGGTAGTNCIAPTTISYQPGAAGVQSAATALASGSLSVLAMRDFNGDGREDVLYGDANSNVYVAFSTGTGFSAPVLLTTLSATSVLAYGDVLGKGQNDILVSVSNVWWRYSWNGSAFVGTSTGIALDAGVTYAALIDINGDGLADLVTATAGNLIAGQSLKIYSRLNTSANGTQSFSSTESVTTLPPCAIHTSCFPLIDVDGGTASTLRSLDFNGDGMKDIVVRMLNQQTGHVFYDNYILASNGTSFNVPTPAVTNNTAPYIYLNANNDACTDIAQTTSLYLASCNGAATGSAITLSGSAVGAMDWDGDGLDDLLVANGTTLGVIESTGTGATTAITSTTIPYSSPTILASPFDQNGDGLADLLVNNNGNLSYYLHNGAGTPPDLVSKITDGYGNSVSPSYGYLTQAGSLYLNFTDATFPYKNYIGPLYVVSTTTFSDPSSATGGTYTQTMSYYGAWMNLQGRGFSGFDEIGNLDSRNGVWEVKFYRRDFPYTGRLAGDWISQSNTENTFSVKENNTFAVTNLITTANNQSFFPYVSNSTSSYYELGGPENADLITTTSTNYTFDNYGNATNIVKTVTDNDPGSPYSGNTWTTSITNTTDISANQSADLAAWCLNMLDETQVTYSSSWAGATSVTRTKMFTPDTPSNCRIQSIITEPTANSGLYKVTEAFTFDSFGNLATDILTGAHMPASPASRETQLNWGTTGQFVNSVTDPSNATTSFTYASTQSLTFGLPDSVKDANNLITSWAYDTLGRKTKETRPDGTSTTWTWALCTASCGWSDSEYQVAQTLYQSNGTTAIRTDTSFFDPIDRVTEISGPTVTGSTAIVQKLYNSLGLLTQQSIPFLSGGTAYQTSYSYDLLNRISSVSRPTSSTNSAPQSTQYAYVGRKTTITDPLGNTKTTITDVKGGLRQTKDGIGYNITRTFDAAESLTGVTDSAGNTLLSGVTIVYGLKPYRTASTDADLGSWLFSIDSLGEKTGWTDAKGQVFSETYDALSRPLTRTDPDLFTQWTYGSTPGSFNVGQLIAECTGTGTACNASGYSESRTFDSFGRPSTRSITQGSNPGNDPGGVFLFTSAYSATTGMPLSLTYPISTSTVALKLQYAYSNGLLQSVTDISDTTAICGSSCTLWTANAMNSFGEITQETLGNGVVTNRTFDAVTSWLSAATAGVGGGTGLLNQSYAEDRDGNIIERQNNTLGLTENFFYDADNRLTCATLASTCSTPTLVYDNGVAGPGNITTQVGVGTYGYPAAGQPRPHAVTSLTGTFNGITNPSFSYDANGNMTNRASSGVNVTWSSYNYPITISGSDVTGSEEVQFLYGPDRQRWKQIYTGPTGVETTYYIGGLVDMVFTGGVANYRHYIYAGGEPVAVYSRTAAGVNTMSYMVEDHEGGIANIASKAGASDINESFSAFGLRRSPTSWSGAPVAGDLTTIAGLSRQGYTFQTWLGQSMGLNHMNGRVQDAILGRFLSPDPHIPDPSNAQSYNRYSYVNNNPLSATDPTGFVEVPDPNNQDQGSGVGGVGGDPPTGSLISGPSTGDLTIVCNTQTCSNQLNAANYPARTGGSVGATPGDTTSATTLANAAAQSPDPLSPIVVTAQYIPLGEITVSAYYSDAPHSQTPTGVNTAPYWASPQFTRYAPAMNQMGNALIIQMGAALALPAAASATLPAGGSTAAVCTICVLNVGADIVNYSVDVLETMGTEIEIETTNAGSALETALEYAEKQIASAWRTIQTVSGP
jgi:RHS repeat-associated protein